MGPGLCIIDPGVPATRGSAWGPVASTAFKAVRRAVTPSEVGSTPTRFRHLGGRLARRDSIRGEVVPVALAVHGGAWNIPDDSVAAHEAGIRCALEHGWERLRGGASGLDVVEEVIRILEDDPNFDAGRGSRLNDTRKVEMDASIMDGSNLDAGAVGAIQCVRHPISIARRVMIASPHVMLVGTGARRFAVLDGAELCRIEDLLVGRELERYLRVAGGEDELVELEFDPEGHGAEGPMGTVGAVALDRAGHVAAATSTGGTQNKAAGRLGDSPVIGAGTYADDRAGGSSATGWGEGILRVLPTKKAVDLMGQGFPVAEAGALALATLDRVGGKGGLILVDRNGQTAAVFNTPRMARGSATELDGLAVAVERTAAR